MVGPSAIYRGVGIDVEALIKSPVLESIRPGVATVEEMACTGVQDQSLALTLIFSGKEALFKALYPQVRRILDFSAAQLVSISEEWMEFVLGRLRLSGALVADSWFGMRCTKAMSTRRSWYRVPRVAPTALTAMTCAAGVSMPKITKAKLVLPCWWAAATAGNSLRLAR
jgi:4'-phosphopantetheinyl transferase EntD